MNPLHTTMPRTPDARRANAHQARYHLPMQQIEQSQLWTTTASAPPQIILPGTQFRPKQHGKKS
jgi:hypothetical protein